MEDKLIAMSELRYHPFLDTWVITATHRQDRTYHPPADFCPLCPTKPNGFPTEIPLEDYDIVVFENRFPSLLSDPPEPAVTGSELMPVRCSAGVCEVVCYSPIHCSSFAELPLSQVRKLARVWKERYLELSTRDDVEYVFIFENKGAVIGVTLSHPHGQIYGYSYVPAIPAKELESEEEHFAKTGRQLAEDWLNQELDNDSKLRVIFENKTFVALVPFFARYTYEVHIAAKAQISCMAQMSGAHLDDLSEALLVVARAYDQLFGFSMPYIMAMHQFDAPWTRFHVEFYPPHRTAEKLKYLAGSESGAGAFINDLLPEDAANQLRKCVRPVK